MESWLDDEKKTNKQIQLKKKKKPKGREVHLLDADTNRERGGA